MNNKSTAAVIYSRYHAQDPNQKDCGAGLIQQHLIKVCEDLGYTTYFAGQEDSHYPEEITNADIIFAIPLAMARLSNYDVQGTKYLIANNTHYKVKNARMMESAKKWGLQPQGMSDPAIFQKAYDFSDYILVGENFAGRKNFIGNGIDAEKILYWPNAVDPNVWRFGHEKNERLTFVCYSSELSLRKGIPALVTAWKQYVKENPDADLVMIGAPSEATFMVSDKKPEDNIYLYASLYKAQDPNIIQIIQESHVGVLATLEDAQCASILEMASCGLPLISTRESGHNFTDNFCEYVDADSVGSILSALRYYGDLYKDYPGVLQDKGYMARQFVLSYHTWSNFEGYIKDAIALHE
jgi:glycosyltransferase involved in cell wall biosynthesis